MVADELRSRDDGARSDGPSGLLLTLDRGIQVLEQIARGQGRVSAKSLTADLGINLGTCYQLLRTLQAHGYVQRLQGGRYGLGSRVGFLADLYGSSVAPPPELIDLLHELRDTLCETTYIVVHRNGGLPVVAALEGSRTLRVASPTAGESGPPHASAAARAFLAAADDSALDEFFDSHQLEAITSRTITKWKAFLAELEATRDRGWARETGELDDGVAGLAAAILDEEGRPFGAFGVSVPATRLPADEATIAAEVVAAAHRASQFLGYTGA